MDLKGAIKKYNAKLFFLNISFLRSHDNFFNH